MLAALRLALFAVLSLLSLAAQAGGWRVTSAMGSPGNVVSIEVVFEADTASIGGELVFLPDARRATVESITPIAGTCSPALEGAAVHARVDLPASNHPGRYTACRVTLRLPATAWNGLSNFWVHVMHCRTPQDETDCSLDNGAVKVVSATYRGALSFDPAVPVAGQPFRARVTLICDWLYNDGAAPWRVSVSEGTVRIDTIVMESFFHPCPGDPYTSYEFEIPGLSAGTHRIEMWQTYYYGDPSTRTMFDFADLVVAEATSAPQPIPSAGDAALGLLALALAAAARCALLSARALRTW